MNNRQKKILGIVLAAIFTASIAYSFYFKIPPLVDARAYDTIARNIVEGHGYRESLEVPIAEDNSIIRIGPGYEYFLALIYWIFGHHYEVVWVIHAILLTLTAFLAFQVSRQVFREKWDFKISLIAAILVGFSPDLVITQAMLLTETLGLALMMLTVWLFFWLFEAKEKTLPKSALLGLALGVTILVRTSVLFLIPPIIGYVIWKKRWRELAMICVLCALPFLPWIVRNVKTYDTLIVTNRAGNVNLIVGNHLGASGEQEPFPQFEEDVKELGYLGATDKATNEAISFVMHHPIEFMRITSKRIVAYFSFVRPTGFWFHLTGWKKAVTLVTSSIYSVILFTLGLWGIVSAWKDKNLQKEKIRMLLLMALMMPLSIIFIVVETRYRFPIYPFLAVCAGFGVIRFLKKEIPLKILIFTSGILILNTVLDIFQNFERIAERLRGL